MNTLFFAALVGYFAASVFQFVGASMKKEGVRKIARIGFLLSFSLHTAFMVWRGIEARRVPLSNQFEFASAFAWAAVVMGFVLYKRLKQEWVMTVAMPVAFLVLSYAAFQPMEIKEMMPALRSTWFVLHIGSAAFAYAAFAIAGGLGVSYLVQVKKAEAKPTQK